MKLACLAQEKRQLLLQLQTLRVKTSTPPALNIDLWDLNILGAQKPSTAESDNVHSAIHIAVPSQSASTIFTTMDVFLSTAGGTYTKAPKIKRMTNHQNTLPPPVLEDVGSNRKVPAIAIWTSKTAVVDHCDLIFRCIQVMVTSDMAWILTKRL
eukprot:TRINITY_DN26746_c0_g1_i1.p1 TRINITY_DN26746_c0_g1~~TRINITY_DN26746_c0_g1_i1.p1  ORF type:complete len:154 (+),score=10.15 TRINITY_DN26746_c0_g1_i1:93-554(+)